MKKAVTVVVSRNVAYGGDEIRVFLVEIKKFASFRPRAERDEIERKLRPGLDKMTLDHLVNSWPKLPSLLEAEKAAGNEAVFFVPTGRIEFTKLSSL